MLVRPRQRRIEKLVRPVERRQRIVVSDTPKRRASAATGSDEAWISARVRGVVVALA